MTETVGIVGLGDLGGRLTLQAEAAGFEVMTYESNEVKTPKEAVDPSLTITGLQWPPVIASSAEEVMKNSTVIHWCAPLDSLMDLHYTPHSRQLLILHDSAMTSSLDTAEHLINPRWQILGNVGIAHMLMNEDKQVFVANDAYDHRRTVKHMEALGLNVDGTTIDQHDMLMAHSQARLAWGVLFDLPVLLGTPAKYLTPSGADYLKTLKLRNANWTNVTLRSIFMNPHIAQAESDQALARIEERERNEQ